MRIIFAIFIASVLTASANQLEQEGKILYETRCAICHGVDAHGTGPLAHKSNPAANDLTSPKFQERLKKYPGVIVASVVLMPNGTLIPDTLKKNKITLPRKDWKASELRALNEYLVELIKKEQH
ncbi:MAG: cytochrome c [Verrucomicrobia bacterium]|nr:cytochrome c [Verrucomicrobiota bacterium]